MNRYSIAAVFLGACVFCAASDSAAYYRIMHPGVCNPSYFYDLPSWSPTGLSYDSNGLTNNLTVAQGFTCALESDGDLPYWTISYFALHGMDKPSSGTFFQRCVMNYRGSYQCSANYYPTAAVPGVNSSYVLSIGGGSPWTTMPTEGAYLYVKLAPTARLQHMEFDG